MSKLKFTGSIIILALLIVISACSEGERIEPKAQTSNETGIFGGDTKTNETATAKGFHKVEVVEVLNTTKYSYLLVKEDGEPYWIATVVDDYKVGDKCVYKDGLLKTNFKSIEHNRVFEKLYLVSNIQFLGQDGQPKQAVEEEARKTVSNTFKRPDNKDLIPLADIIKSADKYHNKTIKIYGEVVKVNANIMGKNWLHLKDGTADDYDFVVTSQLAVPIGHAVILEGTIATNKDFGSGYSYEVIMEDAKPVQ